MVNTDWLEENLEDSGWNKEDVVGFESSIVSMYGVARASKR